MVLLGLDNDKPVSLQEHRVRIGNALGIVAPSPSYARQVGRVDTSVAGDVGANLIGIAGVYLQILDPVEEEFPYAGRARFESVGRQVRHETDQAASLRDAYLARLAERRDDLARVARRSGWQLILHRTDESPRRALLQLYAALGGV